MLLVVGRIGRAHGVRGDVFVEPFTDEPDIRFADGAQLQATNGQLLTVSTSVWHSGKLVVRFVGSNDRTAAENLRGLELQVDVDPSERPTDPDEYYDRQLVGLRAVLVDGTSVGEVVEVIHLPSQDLLAVRTVAGREALIPFVNDIVPEVDLAGGRIVLTPPDGLIDDSQAIEVREEQP
jgi:16S rRNA processing protein RimM